MPRAVFLLLRLVFVGFFLFTSLYCLFAYTPFTYTHVLQAGLLPWLASFARIHHWLYLLASAAAVATLWSDRRASVPRWLAIAFAIASTVAGVMLANEPIVPRLSNDVRSFWWSQIALVPLLAVALIDHVATGRTIVWASTSTREDGAVFAASVAALALVFITYSTTFHVRVAASLGFAAREEAVGLLLSLLLHSCFVGAAFLVWCLTRALAEWMRGRAAWIEYGMFVIIAVAVFALLARNVVFTAISLKGPFATGTAITWGLVVIATMSGLAVRGQSAAKTPVESGLRLLLSPIAPSRAPRALQLAWIVLVVALAIRLQVVASRMDFNGLVQKLCASLVWILMFAATLATLRPRAVEGGRTLRFIFLASLGTLAYGTWRSYGHPADSAPVLAKVAAAEPSFGFLYDLAGAEGKQESLGELFALMQRNTSFTHETAIEPLDVNFASDLGSPPGPRPHVFIIVVDSLRRDYVAPFNSAVTFTPRLAKFAASSDVFANAFTHYGATGLSEPSIWVGGMMPHKQYITPFAPMNALEKLLIAERYVRMVSVDSILAQILDQKAIVPLDASTATGDYDLCATLGELRTKVEARRNQGDRLFAYTQSQNIHASSITREGASVPAGESYPGFYAPYASRLRRIDECFGRFIDYLESSGLYDDSIVVFTADHGDLLGEEGRWGHAYNLNPEIVRIPLIIHRPAQHRRLSVDTAAVAFSTDIAPSIYRLMGYMPATLGAGFGQSLYGPRSPTRDWHMLVSSYGPVYGILEDEGRRLYVADAVNYTDTYFDVTKGSNATREPVSEEIRQRHVQRIVAGLNELQATFHMKSTALPSKPPPAASVQGAPAH